VLLSDFSVMLNVLEMYLKMQHVMYIIKIIKATMTFLLPYLFLVLITMQSVLGTF